MSIPITRRISCSFPAVGREQWATRHLRISAHSATGRVAGAASYKHELAAHHINRPTHLACSRCPLSRMVAPYARGETVPAGQADTAIFILVTNAIESLHSCLRK